MEIAKMPRILFKAKKLRDVAIIEFGVKAILFVCFR